MVIKILIDIRVIPFDLGSHFEIVKELIDCFHAIA